MKKVKGKFKKEIILYFPISERVKVKGGLI